MHVFVPLLVHSLHFEYFVVSCPIWRPCPPESVSSRLQNTMEKTMDSPHEIYQTYPKKI